MILVHRLLCLWDQFIFYSRYSFDLSFSLFQAWELWREGKCLEFADSALGDSYPLNDVLRCIHIGLLCVQDSPIDRPSMSDVVFMITNETVSLVPPKQPAFFRNRSLSKTMLENFSINKVSVSEIEARWRASDSCSVFVYLFEAIISN